jgi:hypothetical protein
LALTDIFTYLGRNLQFTAGGSLSLADWIGEDAVEVGKNAVFVFGALDDIIFHGDFTFENDSTRNNNALLLGAGSEIIVEPGSVIEYTNGHTVLVASRMTVSEAVIKSRYSLSFAAAGTSDNHYLAFQDVELWAGDGQTIHFYADTEIRADLLRFDPLNTRELYMQSKTIVLGNISFPDGSVVYLLSELGPIDGKYPNFGDVLPGRVNFLTGVQYGDNDISDRAGFDLWGENILIDKPGWFGLEGDDLEAYKGYEQQTRAGLYLLDNTMLVEELVGYFGRNEEPLFELFGEVAPSSISEFWQATRDSMNEDLFQSFLNVIETRPYSTEIADAGIFLNDLLTDVTISASELDSGRIYRTSTVLTNTNAVDFLNLLGEQYDQTELASEIIDFIAEQGGAGPDFDLSTINTDLIGTRAFEDVGDLYGLTTEDLFGYVAANITVDSPTVDVGVVLDDGQIPADRNRAFAMLAIEDILVEGKVSFQSDNTQNNEALLLLAMSRMHFEKDSAARYEQGHLIVGAAENMTVESVDFGAEGTFAIGTLNNLTLKDVSVDADRLDAYADNYLSVENLRFSDSVRNVYMEASTVVLADIDFSSDQRVRLVSRDGPIDGKYPNFLSIIPGRVNFLDNVTVDLRLVMDRDSFDQHADNITISGFENPNP